MNSGQKRDDAEAKLRRAERFEALRLRCLELKRSEPEMPAAIIAKRLGVGACTAKRWLREAGLQTRSGARWPP